jgi:hypothetical protein
MSEILPIGENQGHACALEFVPNSKRPREIYVVLDGRRIATRGQSVANGQPAWVPLIEGFEVLDERPDLLAVYFHGKRLQ